MDKHSIIAKDMMEGVKGYTLPSLTIKTSALQEFSTLSSELTSARKKINEESIHNNISTAKHVQQALLTVFAMKVVIDTEYVVCLSDSVLITASLYLLTRNDGYQAIASAQAGGAIEGYDSPESAMAELESMSIVNVAKAVGLIGCNEKFHERDKEDFPVPNKCNTTEDEHNVLEHKTETAKTLHSEAVIPPEKVLSTPKASAANANESVLINQYITAINHFITDNKMTQKGFISAQLGADCGVKRLAKLTKDQIKELYQSLPENAKEE